MGQKIQEDCLEVVSLILKLTISAFCLVGRIPPAPLAS